MIHKLLLVATLALLPQSSQAGFALTAATSVWKNADEMDAYLQTPVCRAFTGTSTSKEPVEFSMAYPKDGKLLPMVALKTKAAPALIAVKITSTELEYFFLLKAGATNEEANLFWYAPVNFARMEAMVRERDFLDLVLDPKGAKTPVKVNLAGSSNALDTVKKCLKTTSLPADFFKLLNSAKDNLTPDLGDRSPLFLLQTVQQAYESFNAGRGIQAELARLRAANKPLLDKEAAAIASVKTTSAAFTAAKSKLDTATARAADLSAKLADAKATLARLQGEKPVAEADLAKKKATYLPLKAQMVPYEKAVVDALAAVKSIQAEIAKNEALIVKNTRRIPELESESASLRRQIPGLESRVRSTRSEYDDADREYRNYDVRRETDRFLDRDSSYSWAKRDLDTEKRNLDQSKIRYWAAHTKMFAAKSAMENCQRQPNNPNCSNEQSAYQAAEREWQEAFREQSNHESKIRDLERKIGDIEDECKRKAQRESDDLRRKRDSAESDYDSARRALTDAENRVSEIRSAIPVLRKQIETAKAALPILAEKLTAAQAAHAQKISARDAFSGQIGFAVAEQQYLDADKLLKEIVAGIAARTKEIPVLAKDLDTTQKSLPALTKAFTSAETALKAAEAKLAPISEQLKPFRAEEALKQAALDAEGNRFKGFRAAYQDLVKELSR